MKRVLLLCAFMFSLSLTVTAQTEDNSDFKKETIEFIKLTGAASAFENAIDQIGMTISETNKEAYTKEASGTLIGIYGKLADVYMKEFTQAEVKELIAFYKTELGKKLVKKQLDLAQKAMVIGQSWGMEIQAIAQKYNR